MSNYWILFCFPFGEPFFSSNNKYNNCGDYGIFLCIKKINYTNAVHLLICKKRKKKLRSFSF